MATGLVQWPQYSAVMATDSVDKAPLHVRFQENGQTMSPLVNVRELVLYPLMVGNYYILCTYVYSSGINTVHTINIAYKICNLKCV